MIRSFRHAGLRSLYEGRGPRRVSPEHARKLLDILATLDHSKSPHDMDLPGYRPHTLKGKLRGYHAVSVSGNWRVIFRFENGDAVEVGYIDYH